jgi:hypothetical protein
VAVYQTFYYETPGHRGNFKETNIFVDVGFAKLQGLSANTGRRLPAFLSLTIFLLSLRQVAGIF